METENLLSTPPAIVGEQVAGRSALVRHSLSTLASNLKRHTFDLALGLFEARDYYREWGFKSLGDYGAQELDLKKRKVEYLIKIVEVCQGVGLERSEYEPAGVSKLREITTLGPAGSYFNPDTKELEPLEPHIIRLILEAPKMTYAEVETEVARLKGQVEENKLVLRSYKVTQSTYDNVIAPAVELARKKLGSQGRDSEGNAKEFSDGAVEEVIHQSFLLDLNNYPEQEQIDASDAGGER